MSPSRTPHNRALAAALIVIAGLAIAFGPYAWADGWSASGLDVTVVLDLLAAFPFLTLATLVSDRRTMTTTGALLATVGLAAATLLMQRFVLYSTVEGAEYALPLVPLALTLATPVAYVADLRLQRRRAALAELGEAPWLRDAVSGRAAAPLVAAIVAATAAVPVLSRALGVGEWPVVETFVVLFTSIAVEALPFVLLGALVSAAIQVYVSDRAFERAAALPLKLQVPGAVLGGFAFPVCECGSVPVARRLILRGLHPAAGLTFMLASPILNPIVLFSTIVAYQGRGALEMTLGRAGLGIAVALVAALAIGGRGARNLLRPRAQETRLENPGAGDGAHGTACRDTNGHDHGVAGGRGARGRALVEHLSSDFLFMGKFVVAGAALAAAVQTGVPQSAFSSVLASPLVGSLTLMSAAFVLSLCSEADAFVAVSFIQFPLAAQLAFLVFGPVLDLKLALLYGATFGRRFVVRLLLITVPAVLAGALVFQEVTS